MWTPTNKLTNTLPFKPLGSLAANNYGSAEENLAWQSAWLAAPGTPGSLGFPTDFAEQWNV